MNDNIRPQSEDAETQFNAMMQAALHRDYTPQEILPDADKGFFCPGILQREFMVAAKGDRLNGQSISHAATIGVASSLVLVLHKGGIKPTMGIAHFDSYTDMERTVDRMLSEFSGKPDRADIFSYAFDKFFYQTMVNHGADAQAARKLVGDILNNRDELAGELGAILFDRYIPIRKIDMNMPHTAYVADVETGTVWTGYDSEAPIFWHTRDVNTVLKDLYESRRHLAEAPAINPYAGLIARAP